MELRNYTKIKLVALSNEIVKKEPELKTGLGVSTFTPNLKATLDIYKLRNYCRDNNLEFESTVNEVLLGMLNDIVEESTTHILVSLLNKNGEVFERSIDLNILESMKKFSLNKDKINPVEEIVNMCLKLNN